MPNYLALQWGRAGIRGLVAAVNGGAVQVRASFTDDWPAQLDAANDPEGVGLWLKSRIEELGAGDHRLIVLISREDTVMRLLALPEANDDTIADLVRYQTGARSSVPLDQLALDYLPLAAAPPNGGRWVQAATVPERMLQHIKRCAEVAGLDLCRVGVTGVAVGQAIAHAERLRQLRAGADALVICIAGGQQEVALWRGADLLFSHGSRVSDFSAAAAEVQRALMSHQGVTGEGSVGRAWLIAPPEGLAELQAALAERLGCQIIVFDQSRDLPSHVNVAALGNDAGSFIAAIGALEASVQATVPTIDFLQPRRRAVKRDRTRIRIAVAAGLLLIVLVAGYFASRLYLSSLDQRIAGQTKLVEAGETAWKQGEPARQAVQFLSTWDRQRVNWLDPMQRIGGEMPGTESVYLDRWQFDRGAASVLGTTEATGYARRRQDAERLTQRLAEQPGFRIRPNSIGPGGNDPDYPILFQLNAELLAPDPQPASKERE